MNPALDLSMVRRLIHKDWQLNRWMIVSYLALGVLALAILGYGSEGTFYAGSVLMFSALIGVGIHLIIVTVLLERKEQTLAFVMSLPISPIDYTCAKLLANLGAFLFPWATLTLATLGVIYSHQAIADGLVPYALLVLTEILVSYCLMLAVALVSESEGWTILAIVVCNLMLNFFLYKTSNMPAIQQHLDGPTAVWNETVLRILAIEVGLALVVVCLTFMLQARKRDFL